MSDSLRNSLTPNRARPRPDPLDESITRLMRGYTPFQALSDPARLREHLPLLRAAEAVFRVRVPRVSDVRRDAALDRMLLELDGASRQKRGTVTHPRRSVLQALAAVLVVAGIGALVWANMPGLGDGTPVARDLLGSIPPQDGVADTAAEERTTLQGSVASVDADAGRLVLSTPDGERVITVGDDTEILREGERVELAALRAGDQATVEAVSTGDGTLRAVRIEVERSAPAAAGDDDEGAQESTDGVQERAEGQGNAPGGLASEQPDGSPAREANAGDAGPSPAGGVGPATVEPAPPPPSPSPKVASPPAATPSSARVTSTPTAQPTVTPIATEPLPTETAPAPTATPENDNPGQGPKPTKTPSSYRIVIVITF